MIVVTSGPHFERLEKVIFIEEKKKDNSFNLGW